MKRRTNRRSSRKSTKNLDFQRLEPRQLLAGDLAGAHQVAASSPAGSNLVANGDFESFADDVDQSVDNFYTQDEVSNWLAKDGATGQQLNILNYQGFDNVLDLDSTEDQFDRVYQIIDTEVNTEYVITFDFRSHTAKTQDDGIPTLTDRTNDFEVWFEGNLVATYTSADAWETGSVTVTSGSTGSSELLFCEIQEGETNQGDSRGAFLDNIRMFKANRTSLIDNASFEVTSNERELFFPNADVESWNAIAAEESDRLMKIVNNDNSDVDSTEGEQYLNLDSQPDVMDIVYQDIATTAGATYLLAFDYRTDGVQDPESIETIDEFRVRWIAAELDADGVNAWAATYSSQGDWQSVGLILTADSDNTRLMFLEPSESNGGDGSGALIDNLNLFEIQSADLNVDLNGSEDGVNGTATYVPGIGSQAVVSSIALTNPNADRFTSATITLGGVLDGTDEVIGVSEAFIPTDESGDPVLEVVGYNSASRQLVLTGEATAEQYQTVLSTLSYFNNSDSVTTGDRTVTIQLADSNLPVARSTTEATVVMAFETDQTAIDDAIIQKFIADNELAVVDQGDSLFVTIDEPGTGVNPTINDQVRVKYTGRFLELNAQNQIVEGATFDASGDDGATFPLSGVIVGWQRAIPVYKTGGSGKLIIPSDLAYGPSGRGSIPPNAVLVFDIELLEIL